jgi:hypothetical protein
MSQLYLKTRPVCPLEGKANRWAADRKGRAAAERNLSLSEARPSQSRRLLAPARGVKAAEVIARVVTVAALPRAAVADTTRPTVAYGFDSVEPRAFARADHPRPTGHAAGIDRYTPLHVFGRPTPGRGDGTGPIFERRTPGSDHTTSFL